MPLRDASEGPGDWTVPYRGASGTRYRMRFHGQQLEWISRWDEAHAGKPYSYRYWRRVWYRKARNGVIPRSPKIRAVFDDLGIAAPEHFIQGKHFRMIAQ